MRSFEGLRGKKLHHTYAHERAFSVSTTADASVSCSSSPPSSSHSYGFGWTCLSTE